MGRFVFKLPDVGEGIAEAELVEWKVSVGDVIEEDAPIADIMTDKANVEIGSPVAGKVVERNGEAGQMIPIGSALVVIETEAGDEPAREPTPQTAAEPAATVGVSRYEFRLPDVGEGIAEAELVEWKVAVGDVIDEDAPVAEIMTDKANVEIGSPVAGRVIERRGDAGQMLPIGSTLIVLEIEGAAEAGGKGAPRAAATAPVQPQPAAAPDPRAAAASGPRSGPVQAAPAIRYRARQLGVLLDALTGSGPGGRILHEDLDAYLMRGAPTPAAAEPRPPAKPKVAAGDGETIKVTGLRRRIAERMTEAGRIPQLGYVDEIDVTALEDLRARLNAKAADDRPRLSLLPFLVAALVRVLPEFPEVNAHYDDQAELIHRHKAVHVGIAAQTDRGLVVAVLHDAQALDLWAAAAEIARLAEAARSGKATLEELTGSTITVTSLGRLGGIATAPIINPPEVAILGPNKIAERAMVVKGEVVVRKMMNLSSSFDHRVVDGQDAALFIQALKAALESPADLGNPG